MGKVSILKFSIENWMTSELGLNGNQLVLFAVLWNDSKHGIEPIKDDYAKYAAAINTTIPTYYNTFKKLVEKGLLTKVDGDKYNIKTRFK